MALLPIIVAPDPRLKVKCAPVVEVDKEIVSLLGDMLESMYDARGIGLAAPQVGVHKRLIVLDVAEGDQKPAPLKLVNPEIIERSAETELNQEGCLSLPEHWADIPRHRRVTVRYLDESGRTRDLEADGMLSVCLQHEIDHLDGILFVDYLSALKRNVILRKLKKLKAPAKQTT